MSMEVTCPQGHRLRVDEKFSGRRARCPSCKSVLLIPMPISDDDIVSLMGPKKMAVTKTASTHDSLDFEVPQPTGSGGSSILGSAVMRQHNKVCPNCEDIVPAAVRVCPHCHVYMASYK